MVTPQPGEMVRLARTDQYGIPRVVYASVVSSAGNLVVAVTGVPITLQKRGGRAYEGGGYTVVTDSMSAFEVRELGGILIASVSTFEDALAEADRHPGRACVVFSRTIVAFARGTAPEDRNAATVYLRQRDLIDGTKTLRCAARGCQRKPSAQSASGLCGWCGRRQRDQRRASGKAMGAR